MPKYSVNPVGTIEELEALGLDVARFGSCAPTKGPIGGAPTVMGCPFYNPKNSKSAKCTLPCKNKGPENVKVRILKSNGKRLERAMPCYEYYRDIYPENKINGGDVSRVVGIAGEGKELTYEAKETMPEKSVGHNNTIKVVHKPIIVSRKIEPFVRPKDNPAFAEDRMDTKIREMDELDRVDATWRERMGVGQAGRDAFLSDDFMKGEVDEKPTE